MSRVEEYKDHSLSHSNHNLITVLTSFYVKSTYRPFRNFVRRLSFATIENN